MCLRTLDFVFPAKTFNMPNIKRVAKRQFVEEVEVDGPDSPHVEEIITEKERSELNDWTND